MLKKTSSVITDKNKIEIILSRGVEEVIDLKNLKAKLLSGQQLRIKFGIDPTSPNIHLGRSVPLLKLRDFQEAGHKIVFIIGDFTALIGDTSDKESERPMLSRKTVEQNMKDYIKQAGKIIDIKKCELHHNSEWLDKLTYREICEHTNVFSVAEFIARDNIRKRLKAGSRVSLREMVYPLMQGYDSVAIKADVEIGGTDQRFNLLAGRTLQNHYGQPVQDVVMGPLMEGTDGRKMSSSWGNSINLLDSPEDMYGKIMSLRDELIIKYFILATRVDLDFIKVYEKDLKGGQNPRDIKMILAKEIVGRYYDLKTAESAEENFKRVFQQGQKPTEISEVKIDSGQKIGVLDLFVKAGLATSNSEVRRLIKEGAIKIDDNKITADILEVEIPKAGLLLQRGKKQFLKIFKK